MPFNPKNQYDVTFLLPIPTFNIPPGGYDIVFQLSRAMKEYGFKCSIIFINSKKYIVWNIIKLIFGRSRISIFYRLLPSINKLRNVDYDYNILRGINLYYVDSIEEIQLNTKAVIATAWSTARTAVEIKEKKNSRGYYLIQNSEDHVSFSGNRSAEASETYSFPLKKIVINDELLSRFSKDFPFFLQIGYNNLRYRRIDGIKKVPCMVLIPLREGKFKGARDGLRAFEILHSRVREAKLVAFGDIEKNAVPDYVEYHFRPTNKKLLELYNLSSVFVLPSIVEGFPTPPLEAMSCGCALVTTRNGGTDKYTVHGVNSLVCDPGQPEAIASFVEELLRDDALRLKISGNGTEACVKYTIETTISQFVEFMKKEFME